MVGVLNDREVRLDAANVLHLCTLQVGEKKLLCITFDQLKVYFLSNVKYSRQILQFLIFLAHRQNRV